MATSVQSIASSQIFISYKREDEVIARHLRDSIKDWGFSPWFDRIDIKPGEDWDNSIHAGLRASQIVVGLLTPESLASRNVLDEWGYALSTGKRLFLLWLRNINEEDIPPRYIRIQRIDIRTDQAAGFAQFRQALESAAKVLPDSATAAPLAAPLDVPATITASVQAAGPVANGDQQVASSLSGALRNVPQYKINRDRMLEKVKVFWVEGVLKQSVYGAVMIELGIQTQLGAVENPWDTVLQHAVFGDYRLPGGTRIADVYRDLNRELLILGNPGSGKTTTLLELARDMIELAEKDDSQPIPVVFNLSSWADERKPLTGWLVDELNTKYQVPRKVAREWVDSDALLLLLDGLDEVDARYRDACVGAINSFRTDRGFTPMVVCSRVADYDALTTRLKLNGAIVLQPLNDDQVNHYLTRLGADFSGFRSAIARDADLRELAESPLMLSIMTLAFRGTSADELPGLDSVDAQRKRLFETYTRRMFERRKDGHLPPDRMRHYLTWLAGRMLERKQSVFYIENLQFDWIDSARGRRLYRIAGRVAFGLIGGLLTGLVATIAFFVLALLLNPASLSAADPTMIVDLVSAFVFGFAGIGGLIFGVAGLQAYALDLIPDHFRPWKTYVSRLAGVVIVGALAGVMALIVVVVALFAEVLLHGGIDLSTITYRGSLGWAAVAMLVFQALAGGAGSGAVMGIGTAFVAIVINTIQPRRQLLRGSVQAIMLASLLGGIVTLVVSGLAVLSGSTVDTAFVNNGIQLAGAAAFTGLFVALAARVIPVRAQTRAYILMSGGLAFYLVAALLINSWQEHWLLSGSDAYLFFLVAILATLGFLVGRINEKVESAEALHWSWSIRWSLLGLAGLIVLGLIQIVPVLNDSPRYNPALDTRMTRDFIMPDQNAIAVYQPELADLRKQWAAYKITIPPLDAIEPLMTERVTVENQLKYLKYADTIVWDDLSLEAPTVSGTHFIGTFFDESCYLHRNPLPFSYYDDRPDIGQGGGCSYQIPTFAYGYGITLDGLDQQLADVRAKLKAYALSDAQLTDLDRLRYAIMRREDLINILQKDVANVHRMYTLAGLSDRSASAIRIALVFGLSLILAGGVVGGLRKTEAVEIRTRPNSGIRRTFFTAIRVTVAFGAVGAVIGGLVFWLLTTLPAGDFDLGDTLTTEAIPFGAILGMAFGMGLGLLMGGSDAVIKHGVLRLFLMRGKNIPRNYARVLDDAAGRILLRKIGGGYIFIHRYLLEYFAGEVN